MKKMVWILAVTTLTLTCTTAYYGQALMREKQKGASAVQTAPTPATRDNSDYSAGFPEAGVAHQAAPPQRAACPDPARIAAARERLLHITDPARRQELLARSKPALDRTWQSIALSMQLPPDELAPVAHMLSEQLLRSDQRRAECEADPQCPPCDLQALNESIREERKRNIADYLGPDRMARYEAYLYAITERVYIDALRASLKGRDVMGDVKAERLVLALAEERRQFIEQMARQGKRVEVGGAGFNVQEFNGEEAPQPFGPSNWELTAEFNERIGRVAAEHLAPTQLAAFRSMQDERLANARFMEQITR